VARGQILGFSIDFRRRPYNILALQHECDLYHNTHMEMTRNVLHSTIQTIYEYNAGRNLVVQLVMFKTD